MCSRRGRLPATRTRRSVLVPLFALVSRWSKHAATYMRVDQAAGGAALCRQMLLSSVLPGPTQARDGLRSCLSVQQRLWGGGQTSISGCDADGRINQRGAHVHRLESRSSLLCFALLVHHGAFLLLLLLLSTPVPNIDCDCYCIMYPVSYVAVVGPFPKSSNPSPVFPLFARQCVHHAYCSILVGSLYSLPQNRSSLAHRLSLSSPSPASPGRSLDAP